MKRLVIVLTLLVCMITTSMYTGWRASRVNTEMNRRLDEIGESLAREDKEELAIQVAELRSYWEREEKTLILFLRHSHVDELTRSVVRLPSLTKSNDASQLGAELDTIRWQVEHIKDAEIPNFNHVI